MAANPYDHTGTLDTTGYGLKPVAAVDTNGVDQGNTAVSSVVAAFTDGSLQSHSDARLLPSQRSFDRTY